MTKTSPKNPLVLGLMSGTSLDGLDLALCEFTQQNGKWSYRILKAGTTDYDPHWKKRLDGLQTVSAEQYLETNAQYGAFVAAQVLLFLNDVPEKPDLIASHGHTVFHQPEKGFTAQIGSGAVIAARTGVPTVCDFRSLDVALGGQGAPLVPIGDQLLFSSYASCLNLGGIANISFLSNNGQRMAYDISEANLLLNFLSEKTGRHYDDKGAMARAGTADATLLGQLNALPYYAQSGVKSLGREWFEKNIQPLFDASTLSLNDQLATATEHVAHVIANDLNSHHLVNTLVTGGGAFNEFLLERIREKTNCELIVPDTQTVQFKEALIFALLGHLRVSGRINTLASVTGAARDSIGGAVYY